MPSSSFDGKTWIRDRIVSMRPNSVLDVGPGCGTYARLLRAYLPGCKMVGLEIFAQYVDRYGLWDWYDAITIADVRDEPLPDVDVVILGDVLEHLDFDDAVAVWKKARVAARSAVFLSLPVVPYPQGPWEGNVHEAHLHTWDHRMVLDSLPGIVDHHTYSEIGVYQAAPDA